MRARGAVANPAEATGEARVAVASGCVGTGNETEQRSLEGERQASEVKENGRPS
jgi:hypothetical protein